MSYRIHPLNDRVVIEEVEVSEKIGSIIIPEMAKQKPTLGKVIAVGLGEVDHVETVGNSCTLRIVRKPMTCMVGDLVLFGKYSGVEVAVNDRTVIVMREMDVLAVLRGQ